MNYVRIVTAGLLLGAGIVYGLWSNSPSENLCCVCEAKLDRNNGGHQCSCRKHYIHKKCQKDLQQNVCPICRI